MKYWEIVADKLSGCRLELGLLRCRYGLTQPSSGTGPINTVYINSNGQMSCSFLSRSSDQRLRAMEREHAAACRARMKVVGQSCFDSGALVCERERVTPLWIDV